MTIALLVLVFFANIAALAQALLVHREVRALRRSVAALHEPASVDTGETIVTIDGAALTPAFARTLGEMLAEDMRRASTPTEARPS